MRDEGGDARAGTAPGGETAMNPGDQAPPGTPGTGENTCRECRGTGRLEGGEECPTCGGTGIVIEAVSAGP
jgi:hypothetical protein